MLNRSTAEITVENNNGSGVTVRTESGEVFTGAALVGCDGLWSTIRSIVVGDGKPIVSGHITYRAVIPNLRPIGRGSIASTK